MWTYIAKKGASALAGLVTAMILLACFSAAVEAAPPGNANPRLLASDLQGSSATLGPDGALYVAESGIGQVTRIDLRNGRRSTLVRDLPQSFLFPLIRTGGVMDVAFIGDDAYVLTSLTSLDGSGIDGIHRVTGEDSTELIADLGTFSAANLDGLDFPIDVDVGLQFAMVPAGSGFLVSDGHHNRVLHVTLDGDISILRQFGNEVPTGLAGAFGSVFVAQLGPLPYLPENGRVLTVDLLNPQHVTTLASGVPMIIDVATGPDGHLYALSQGDGASVDNPVAPAEPHTGRLLRVNGDGTFTVVASGLDLPTSLNFHCNDAVVTSLNGEVRVFKQVARTTGLCNGACP